MEISLGLLIFLSIIFYFVLYIVIETAVRRGIDASKTNEILKEVYKKIEKKD
ncbi:MULTISPECIES: hypothetical protein [Virgibacillus]|uniref:Uncharacterized protein n=2 Tax=Virgibacillus TaxID=84406 RepID=A0A024QC05_9BACI|nr:MULTISPECIES: hypothetical protein [Virgibacillus]EQB36304.1 hypothetical protein M948_14820 [Virgibacillus sp. CM-4]MYL42146.1 hypothetical protein [Virgibacillus massiliensis]GGJ45070.1 hypothetical protein GCM10007111_03870 [Virgibacillus kapii]CDQ40004.1 hypothetical protein BN990_02322 [Virgibacillus massiliensis]